MAPGAAGETPRNHNVDPPAFARNRAPPTPARAAAAIRAVPDDDRRLAVRLIATIGAAPPSRTRAMLGRRASSVNGG